MKVKIYTKYMKEAINTEVNVGNTTLLADFLGNNSNAWLPTDNGVIRISDIISVEKVSG